MGGILTPPQKKTSEVVCDVCSETYISSSDLDTHVLEHLTNCDICGKSFGTESDLEEHILEHVGVSDLVQLDGNLSISDCSYSNDDTCDGSSIPVIISSRSSSKTFENRMCVQ